MEPLLAMRLEPGTLELSMSADSFAKLFTESLSQLPHATGVNNHTGSLLTAHRLPMEWLMANIAQRGLYFLDSRTTPFTVAETTARELAVPTIRRDVFLDHVRSRQHLEDAFTRSLQIARSKGHAVVIAHPHKMTLAFLEEKLSSLPSDIQLASLRELVQTDIRQANRRPLDRPPLDRRALVLLGNPTSPNISLGQ
jgi:polysaccharide deacetylase 2 family uncharacterized protein YibQ